MALQRRTTTQAPPSPPMEGADFGSMGFYTGGFDLPPGDYCWTGLNVMMYQFKDQKGKTYGDPNLTVMITLQSLSDPSDAGTHEIPYGMGRKAHLSWAPNPITGKGLVAVPGSPAAGLNDQTKWALLLKSLYDSALPEGVFTNDLTALEGIHVHMQLVDEPAGWKEIQNNTGDAPNAPRKDKKISVVSEILDSGHPWEGTGGIAAAPTGKAPAKAAPKVNGKAPAAAAKAPAAAEVEEGSPEEIEQIAVEAIGEQLAALDASTKGCSKVQLRTGVFKSVTASKGDDYAQAILETYFGTDAALNGILAACGEYGFKTAGLKVVAIVP